VVAALIALVLAAPPRATIAATGAPQPLAVFSWCWGLHCGAPNAASRGTTVVARRGTVHVDFAFVPTHVTVGLAGRPVAVAVHNREISWRASYGGGLTIEATGARGWVTYVGRIRLR
jgi:hypothetical protein